MKGHYKEFFFFPDITVLVLLIGAGVTAQILHGVSWIITGVFLFGMLTFMFSEYLTHRFLFHIKAPKNPFLLKLIKRLHYDRPY